MTHKTPIHVWIIEDSRELSEELRRILNTTEDIKCTRTFGSAESALSAFSEGNDLPDVALVDIQLPGINGIEAIGRIKKLHPEVHSVVLTISEKRATVFDAICAGASGYLLKNDSFDHIENGIRLVCSGGSPLNGPAASMVLQAFKNITPPSEGSELNEREIEILSQLAEGKVKKEIASEMHIATHTVDYYLRSVYTKLQVNSQAGAVGKAIREGHI